MTTKRSAGILLFRGTPAGVEVLLGHMGGPFFAHRDAGGWSIPKGEYLPGETPIAAAHREFEEELGLPVPPGDHVELGEARQAGGKIVTIWAVRGELDPALVVPGTFVMEWPRGSGHLRHFPEIDRAAWFDLRTAQRKLVLGQQPFIHRLEDHLVGGAGRSSGARPAHGGRNAP